MTQHGGFGYVIFGSKLLADAEFMQAAEMLQEFLMSNAANSGPSLLTWLAFVNGATR